MDVEVNCRQQTAVVTLLAFCFVFLLVVIVLLVLLLISLRRVLLSGRPLGRTQRISLSNSETPQLRLTETNRLEQNYGPSLQISSQHPPMSQNQPEQHNEEDYAQSEIEAEASFSNAAYQHDEDETPNQTPPAKGSEITTVNISSEIDVVLYSASSEDLTDEAQVAIDTSPKFQGIEVEHVSDDEQEINNKESNEPEIRDVHLSSIIEEINDNDVFEEEYANGNENNDHKNVEVEEEAIVVVNNTKKKNTDMFNDEVLATSFPDNRVLNAVPADLETTPELFAFVNLVKDDNEVVEAPVMIEKEVKFLQDATLSDNGELVPLAKEVTISTEFPMSRVVDEIPVDDDVSPELKAFAELVVEDVLQSSAVTNQLRESDTGPAIDNSDNSTISTEDGEEYQKIDVTDSD